MKISQNIYVSQSAQVIVENSEIIHIASQQSSSVDLKNVVINCVDKNCLRASGSSHIHADNLTVNNSNDDSSIDITESSYAEIKILQLMIQAQTLMEAILQYGLPPMVDFN